MLRTGVTQDIVTFAVVDSIILLIEICMAILLHAAINSLLFVHEIIKLL
jgi:hypothetical protein